MAKNQGQSGSGTGFSNDRDMQRDQESLSDDPSGI